MTIERARRRSVHAARMKMAALLPALVLIGGEAAFAAEPSVPQRYAWPLTSRWAVEPTAAEVAAVTPREITGYAKARCTVEADGALTECRVETETPAGAGLGQALLTLTPKYRLAIGAASAPPAETVVMQGFPKRDAAPAAVWSLRPEEARKLWPARLPTGSYAKAQVDCVLSPDGAPLDCEATAEDPSGLGVAEAALAMTQRFEFTPGRASGRPSYAEFSLPISFVPPASNGSRCGVRLRADSV